MFEAQFSVISGCKLGSLYLMTERRRTTCNAYITYTDSYENWFTGDITFMTCMRVLPQRVISGWNVRVAYRLVGLYEVKIDSKPYIFFRAIIFIAYELKIEYTYSLLGILPSDFLKKRKNKFAVIFKNSFYIVSKLICVCKFNIWNISLHHFKLIFPIKLYFICCF